MVNAGNLDDVKCSKCGKVCKTPAGKMAHERKCKGVAVTPKEKKGEEPYKAPVVLTVLGKPVVIK